MFIRVDTSHYPTEEKVAEELTNTVKLTKEMLKKIGRDEDFDIVALPNTVEVQVER